MKVMEKNQRVKELLDCPVKQAIYRLTGRSSESQRSLLFMEAGKVALEAYLNGDQKAFLNYFKQAYADLDFPYTWSYDSAVAEDDFKWRRLVQHIFYKSKVPQKNDRQNAIEGIIFVRDKDVSLVDCYPKIETIIGMIEVPIITKVKIMTVTGERKAYHAYILRRTKNTDYISNLARKLERRPENNAILAAVKVALNYKYPEITIHCVGMEAKEDTCATMVEYLGTSDDAYHSFGEYYADDKSGNALKTFVLQMLEKEHTNNACTECRFEHRYCHTTKYVTERKVENNRVDLSFTKQQKKAITKKKGPILVCACPGSGKTAVLIERVKHLVAAGISPERILLLTFSKSAAANIQARLPAMNGDPYVSTIHSLCLELLRLEDEMLIVEEKATRYHILNMLVNERKIQGASSSGIYGENGFIVRLDQCIQSMREGNVVKFGSFDESELKQLLIAYEEIRKQMHCITYNEMLTLAVDLLKKNLGICRLMQTKFTYMMVDEYQDVDAIQDEFIRLLAGEHGNLMVVGDDDQSIYGFRGGSNEYMLQFRTHFPAAELITLGENFRSTKEIVRFAERLIIHNAERIEKNFSAHKNGKMVECYSAIDWKKDIPQLVQHCLNEGYQYGDIAIISRNNAELKKLYVLFGPDISRLNRTVLCDDPIFGTLLSVLSLWVDPESTEAFLRLIAIHTDIPLKEITGTGIEAFHNIDSPFKDRFTKLWKQVDLVMAEIQKESRIEHIFEYTTKVFFGITESSVSNSLLNYIFQANVNDLKGAYYFIKNLQDINDDTRVVYPPDNRITLLTAHDSKGLEFPCVIVAGLEDFKYDGEESRRLLYVAITRAKEKLMVCQTAGTMLSPYWEEVGIIAECAG